MKDGLLQILQSEFNLTKKDVLLISALAKKGMTADSLCENLKIPKGKIYTFLNKLINLNLIEKTPGFPAIYSVPSLEQKMIDFLNTDFERFVKKQKQMVEIITEEKKPENDFEIIKEKKEFVFKLMEMLAEEKEIKYILRYPAIPYLFYAGAPAEFSNIQEIIVNSREALTDTKDSTPLLLNNLYLRKFKEGSRFEFIVCKKAVDDFFRLMMQKKGRKECKKIIAEIKNKLKKHNVSITLIDELFPLGIYLAKDKVMTVLQFGGAITGIIHKKTEVIKFYETLFREMQERAYPIENYFKKIKM
ncbi:MAG TPA: helix-turn-helix domain-containing protein [archaeon]|nr:helix-turn-helix domain-containing protein [archaeon]